MSRDVSMNKKILHLLSSFLSGRFEQRVEFVDDPREQTSVHRLGNGIADVHAFLDSVVPDDRLPSRHHPRCGERLA